MKPLRLFLAMFGLAISGTMIAVGSAAAGDAVPPGLYGTWDLFEVQSVGMTARVRLTVEKGRVINSTSCSFADKNVHVQVSSPARITADAISIREDRKAHKEYEPGFLNCKVSLDKGTIRYRLVGDHLVLRLAGQDEAIALSRSGATFIQASRFDGLSVRLP